MVWAATIWHLASMSKLDATLARQRHLTPHLHPAGWALGMPLQPWMRVIRSESVIELLESENLLASLLLYCAAPVQASYMLLHADALMTSVNSDMCELLAE